jgi:hypothetical protein
MPDPGFFSAQLDKVQVNYSAFDGERFAIVAVICHFCFMMERHSFLVFTNYKLLVGALSRWSDPWTACQQHHLSSPSFLPPFARSQVIQTLWLTQC